MRSDMHPLRTCLSTAAGALAGSVATFFVGGQLTSMLLSDEPGSTRGLTSLGVGLLAAVVGSLAGGAAGVAVALRDVPGRGVTVATVLLGGLPLSALGVLAVAGLIRLLGLDVLPSTPGMFLLAAVVFLPATALLGRWIAMRRTSGSRRGA